MIEIPLIHNPNQVLAIELEDQDCTMQVRQLGEHVYLTLWRDSDLIVETSICMPGVPVLQDYCPGFKGNFVLIDTSNPREPQQPDWHELGTRYRLYYLTETEINEHY